MTGSSRFLLLAGLLGVAGSIVLACGNATPPPTTAKSAPGGTKDQSSWPTDDKSMCDWRNKPELEVSETAGPGALRPNIRRVYKTLGEGDNRRKVLICREVDTNLDGIKDTVRTFNPKGEALREESDTDYDGRVDHWLAFSEGRVVEEQEDTNGDGKPDVWEIYVKGRLERMGVDEGGDGHVDRWDRDELLRQQQEADEAKTKAAMDADAGIVADAGASADAGDGGKGKRKENR